MTLRKHVLTACAVLCALLPLPASANTPLTRLDVIAFGDSITQGLYRDAQGIQSGITYNPQGQRIGGYEPYLESMIQSTLSIPGYVYNYGVAGENSSNALNRINTAMDSRTYAHMILIMSSANDMYQGITSSTTKFNNKHMIIRARARGIEPIIATITPNTDVFRGSLNGLVQSANAQIRQLESEESVLLADQYLALAPHWAAYHSGDGLHMNDHGNYRLAQAWVDTLKNSEQFNPSSNNSAIIPPIQLLLLD